MKKVKIGGEEFTIQRFRGLKAILAMAALARIARDVPDILADVARSYSARHTVTVTEAMARLPRWEGFSKDDFDEAERNTGKRVIELPAVVSQQDQLLSALPTLLERARKEAIRLFAILIVPNEELKAADLEDRVEEALDKHRDLLLYDAELDELADLALAASDVVKDQLADKGDRLGKLMRSLMKVFQTQAPSTGTITSDLERIKTEALTPSTSSDDAPISSTDSEPRTDGIAPQPSMASPG